MADQHTYKFNISMSCGGCSGAIDRTLKKLENNGMRACPTFSGGPVKSFQS